MNQIEQFDRYEEVSPNRYAPSNIVVSKVLSKVFLWMTAALAITGLTAMTVANTSLAYTLLSSRGLFWTIALVEVGLVWFLSARIMKLSLPTATFLLAIYSVLNGITLSVILMLYARTQIYSAFFITAGTFGAMAMVGYFIKSDLTRWSRFLMMALIGLIIASVVNILLRSSAMEFIVSIIGVLLFTVLTAVDVNKIKHLSAQIDSEHDTNTIGKIAILGALTLYLDFINLFLYILRFFGNSRD